MHRGRSAWLVAAAILAAACGPVATSRSPGSSPTPVPSPLASCEEGIEHSQCARIGAAVLQELVGSGHTPTAAWIYSGMLCPFVDECLFNPEANFPAPVPPDGGRWLGSAEVAFADTEAHAGLLVAMVGGAIEPRLIGYRVPDPSWCSGSCLTAAATDGPFRLELVAPHAAWMAGEPIVATQAILIYDGAAPTPVYGASSIITFGYAEVGGTRSFGPTFDDTCQPTTLDPTTALNMPLGKSGGYDPGSPADAWVSGFLSADGVQLPAGSWDVTAYAQFFDRAGCTGNGHRLRAGLRFVIGG